VVINEALARARFGGEDPVGKSIQLRVSGKTPLPVVGVVADARESVRVPAGMRLYMSNWIYPANITLLLLRMEQDPGEAFSGRIRKAIYDSDPKLIVYMVSSLGEMVDKSLWVERNAFAILKWLSAIAFGLAVIGLFSVLAFAVDSRRREFGIRLALGAAPANLQRLVIFQGLVVAASGVLAGTLGALGLTRFMQSLLFETAPNDPRVYLAVATLLLATASLACWLPARRAAKVDPMVALRAE
jgi:putative ABC transport system permease protein